MGRSDAPAQSFAGGTPSVVVGALAVFAEVEPFALGFLGHPKAGKRLGDEDRDRGADNRPADRREAAMDLDDKLPGHGRGPCREKGCQDGWGSGVAGSYNNKK